MRRDRLGSGRLRLLGAVVGGLLGAARARADDAVPGTADAAPAAAAPTGEERGARTSRVPPVPEGSTEELFAYIESLQDPALEPDTRGRRRYHRRKCLANMVEAVDRILAQAAAGDPAHDRALWLKFAALEQLDRLGEPRAAEALAEFAAGLAASPDEVLAARARVIAARAEADQLVADGRLDDAPALIRRIAALLVATPDDVALAEAAAGLASKLERAAGGEEAARLACETFLPLFERSGDERISRLAGSLRLPSLPGNPMPLAGRLLDGGAFEQEALAGKVVLVDFWATWCGPCVAEIANIREQYDRYHDRGFEVIGISLDADRAALERFVADRGVPWPIIVDAESDGEQLADRYGISGIPRCILVGRDGVVISTKARGRRLAELLAEQFPEAPARP